MDNQDAFNEHVIKYLVKLEIEVRAIRLALEQRTEGLPITQEQMTFFRASVGSRANHIGEQVRREFGLIP